MKRRLKTLLRGERLEPRWMLSATPLQHGPALTEINNIGYFLRTDAPRIERYDIANESWLSPINLVGATGTPTAELVDADGIYVSYGPSVYRYGLDGGGQTHLLNAISNVIAIHSDGNLLFLNYASGSNTFFISINKATNAVIDTTEAYYTSLFGSSISPDANRIFGRSQGYSPSDITFVAYDDSGKFVARGDSPYHGDFPGASKAWVFPGGAKVVDNSGTAYAADTLVRVNSFGSTITDIAFQGANPIVLNGTTITAFSSSVLPTGSMTLTAAPADILVNSTDVITFIPDATSSTSLRAGIVHLSDLQPPTPGLPVNPVGLAYVPDKIQQAANGTVLLFSKANQSIFRWNPATQSYGATIPLVGTPDYMAYSATTNTVYLAYTSGLIRKIDLSAANPSETPFAILPRAPVGLSTARQYVFAADNPNNWASHYTFGPDGSLIDVVDLNYASGEYTWSDINQKFYFFSHWSPSDLYWEEINASGSAYPGEPPGGIGAKKDTPLHGQGGIMLPIRVSPDGKIVLLGSGQMYDAITLAPQTMALANTITDAAWVGGELFTIHAAASGSEIQHWTNATYAPDRAAQLVGTPQALLAVASNRMLAITRNASGVPRFTVLDQNLAVVPSPRQLAVAISSSSIAENQPSGTTVGTLSTADSESGHTYTYSLVSGTGDADNAAFSIVGNALKSARTFDFESKSTYSIRVRSTDESGTTVEQSLTIAITNADDPPTAVDDAVSATEDTTATIAAPGVLSNDSDIEGDAIAAVLVAGPSHGTLTLNANGSLTYAPAPNFNGSDSFTYRASDGTLAGNVATVSIAVAAVNDAPVGAADSFAIATGSARTIPAPGVLANDQDVDGDALAAVLVSGPAHGTLTLNANGSFSYMPNAGATGADSFTYRASDGHLTSDVTTVTLNVTPGQGSIVGTAYNDLNNNGVFEPGAGETAIVGQTVYVDLNGNGRFDATTEPSQVTGANGSYAFNNLPAGHYAVGEVTTSDFTQTTPAQGAAGVRLIDLMASALVSDPVRPRLYASVPSGASAYASTIAVIDTASGTVVSSVPLTASPGKLAISDDGQFLYVAIDSGVQRIDLTTLTTGSTFSIAPMQVDDMAVMPGHPHTIAVERYNPGISPRDAGIAIYDDGVRRLNTAGGGNVIEFSSDGSILYGYDNENTEFSFNRMAVTADGLVGTNLTHELIDGFGTDIEYDGGRIYTTNGVVVDPEVALPLGRFQGGGSVESVSSRGLTFFLSGNTLKAFDQQTFLPVGSLTVAGVADSAYGLIHWGTTGLAFRTTNGKVALVEWNSRAATQSVDLADGQALTGVDFGNRSLVSAGSISGQVYHDANANGAKGPGEPGISGWTVFLDANGNGQLDAGERSTTTDASGNYTFTGVAPGDYVVTELPRDSWQQTAPSAQEATIRQLDLVTNDIVYSAVTGKMYASLGSNAGSLGNSVAMIDPGTGAVLSSVYVGSEPNLLAVSDDGKYLYVSLDGADAVRRVDLATFTAGLQFSVMPFLVQDLEVLPGLPGSVAVTRRDPRFSPSGAGVAIYDDGVRRLNTAGGSNLIAFSGSASVLYGLDTEFSAHTFYRLAVSADGVSSTNAIDGLVEGAIKFDNGRIYAGNGRVIDPETQTVLGTMTAGSPAPDSARGLTYYLSGAVLSAYDQQTFAKIRSYTVPGITDSAGLIDWGSDGLAFRKSTGQLVLLHWDPRHPGTSRTQPVHLTSGQNATGLDFGDLNTAPVNPPVARPETFATSEDVGFSIAAPGVLANDTQLDSHALTAVLVAGPAHGTLALAADGSFTYTPAANFNGSDSFTYRANDNQALSAVTTVFLTVAAVNDPPVAVNNSYTTTEDTARTTTTSTGVLANDTDPENNSLTAILDSAPAHGTLTFNSNGTFTYTPAANFNGTDTFTYHASDGQLPSNVATVTMTVTPVNDPPIAVGDSFAATQDTALSIAAPGVLANDTDVEGSPLTAVLVTGPAHGTLTLNADGSFNYTPVAGYAGTDTFTYRARDGQANSTAAATVTLNVALANPASVAGRLFVDVNQNGVFEPTAGETPLAGHTVYVDLNNNGVLDAATEPSQVTGADGTYSFGNLSPGRTRVSQVVPLSWQQTEPRGPSDVLASMNQQVLEYTRSGDPVQKLTVPTPVPPGNFWHVWDAVADQSGRIHVFQGDFTQGYISTYTPWTRTWEHHTSPGLKATTDIGDNELSIGGNFLYVGLTRFDIRDWSSLVYTYPSSQLQRGLGDVRLGSDGMLYGHNSGSPQEILYQFDPTTFTVLRQWSLLDEHGQRIQMTGEDVTSAGDIFALDLSGRLFHYDNAGTLLSQINVFPNQGSALDLDVSADGYFAVGQRFGYLGIIKTDFTGVSNLFSVGSDFTHAAFATYQGASSSPTSYYVELAAGDNRTGLDFGNSRIGTETAPSAVNDAYAASSGAPLKVDAAHGVLANDTDAEGDGLAALVVNPPSHGSLSLDPSGGFTYTPTAGFTGVDTFTYQASDGTMTSAAATATITVGSINHPPVAADDSFVTPEDTTLSRTAASGVLVNDSDADGDAPTAALVAGPIHGTLTLNPDGSFTYSPAANYVGSDSFTYQARDGNSASSAATVSLTVTSVNDAPVAKADSFSTVEDAALSVFTAGVLANDTDLERQPLSAVLQTGPLHGTLSLAANGSFTYVPAADFNGTDSFTYSASDGTDTSSAATVSITVAPANDRPVAADDTFFTDRNITKTFLAPGVLLNDSDVDGDPLTAILVAGPAHGTLSLLADGSFVYTPAPAYSGGDSFTYRASDAKSTSDPATVTLVINDVNHAPQANPDQVTTAEDQSLEISVASLLQNDIDDDADPLTALLALGSGPAHGTLTLVSSGDRLLYTPDRDFYGVDGFSYRATDGQALSNVASVAIHVRPVNDPPSFTKGPDQYVTDESGPQTVVGWATNISTGPANEVNQALHFILSSDKPGLFAAPPAIDAAGNLTFTPAPNASGTATVIEVVVDDGGSDDGGVDYSQPQVFQITIDKPHPLHNAANAMDVSGDAFVAPNDPLLVIDYLNAFGSATLGAGDAAGEADGTFYDVNGDNSISPIDALLVIDYINAHSSGGEGEAQAAILPAASSGALTASDMLTLLAADIANQTDRKRQC